MAKLIMLGHSDSAGSPMFASASGSTIRARCSPAMNRTALAAVSRPKECGSFRSGGLRGGQQSSHRSTPAPVSLNGRSIDLRSREGHVGAPHRVVQRTRDHLRPKARRFGSRVFASSSSNSAKSSADADEEEEGRGGEQGRVDESALPTMEDIKRVAERQGMKLEIRTLGPWFQINATSLDGTLLLGTAEGFEKWWLQGRLLHLESIRLTREASQQFTGSILGPAFLVGAAAVRHGLDRNCPTAELLAIFDDEATHSKLVKYYSRLGFQAMYEVEGEGWNDIANRVVWGGVGTRMDANCEELLTKWSRALRPKDREAISRPSKGFSPVAQKVQQ